MLVTLLIPGITDEVRAEAAGALAVLTGDNRGNQDKVAAAGGLQPLVNLLEGSVAERARTASAAALWSLATSHHPNQAHAYACVCVHAYVRRPVRHSLGWP